MVKRGRRRVKKIKIRKSVRKRSMTWHIERLGIMIVNPPLLYIV
jgi:hypothetical protein